MPYFALIIMFYHVKIACYQQDQAKDQDCNDFSITRLRTGDNM